MRARGTERGAGERPAGAVVGAGVVQRCALRRRTRRTRSDLETATALFEKIVDPANQPKHEDGRPKYDFTRDYVVLAELGRARSKSQHTGTAGLRGASDSSLLRAVTAYERALAIDPEHPDSHYGLNQCYDQLGHGAGVAPGPGTTVATARNCRNSEKRRRRRGAPAPIAQRRRTS